MADGAHFTRSSDNALSLTAVKCDRVQLRVGPISLSDMRAANAHLERRGLSKSLPLTQLGRIPPSFTSQEAGGFFGRNFAAFCSASTSDISRFILALVQVLSNISSSSLTLCFRAIRLFGIDHTAPHSRSRWVYEFRSLASRLMPACRTCSS